MANKKYEETDIQAIAAAIKEKTGSEEPLYVRDMASGVGEVFEAGKQAEYDEFWDALTANKTKKNFTRAFQETDFGGKRFPDGVTIKNCNLMFYNYYGTELPSNIDLSNVEQRYLDYQGGDSLATYQTFTWATKLKKIYDLKLGAPIRYAQTFSHCRELVTIEMPIKIREDTTVADVFIECNKLVDITFEGVIAPSLDIHWSPLSAASLKNIIKHLKDYAPGDEANHFKYTLTVKASAWDALVESGFTDDDYSWILSTIGLDSDSIEEFGYTWTEIVGALCWNLTLAS